MAIRHAQSEFPVLLEGRVIGLLTRHNLTRWLSEGGADRAVDEVMHRTFDNVDRSEPLEMVFRRLSQEPDKTLLVTDHGRLVGLVGLDEITNLLRFRRAVAGRWHHTTSAAPPSVRRTGAHG
jgi:predicted transcriptional regulator